ncbi:MAG: CPBP family intramembrane metalloprotease, partial [Clostridia bacterium]|nr:CPBP family intramembrane metalloprotease [Clostridia bacterium]
MKKQDLQLNIGEKEGIATYCLCLFASLVLSFFVINMPESNAKTLLSYALTQIAYLLVPIIFLKLSNVDYLSVVPIKSKIKPIGLLLVVPITIGAFLQNTILAVLLNRLFNLFGINPMVTLPATDTPLNAILAVLTVVILAPIAEEGLYRGVILSSHKSLGVWKSALITALIFALSHFNLAQLAHQFVLGFLLAITVLLTGNIWYAVAIH